MNFVYVEVQFHRRTIFIDGEKRILQVPELLPKSVLRKVRVPRGGSIIISGLGAFSHAEELDITVPKNLPALKFPSRQTKEQENYGVLIPMGDAVPENRQKVQYIYHSPRAEEAIIMIVTVN